MTETQALLLAFGFGIAYNYLVAKLIKTERGNGFAGIWVVIGVFVTLIISTFARVSLPRLQLYWFNDIITLTNQQHAAFYELKFFMAAGIPMFLGSLWRYLQTKMI
jgi:hypothetical protein